MNVGDRVRVREGVGSHAIGPLGGRTGEVIEAGKFYLRVSLDGVPLESRGAVDRLWYAESELEPLEPEPLPETSAPRFYLAGPMSGIEDYNAPAFREAARVLRIQGYEVISPVELDDEEGFEHSADEQLSEEEYLRFLRRDLIRYLTAEVHGIVVLPGWEASRGAALEVHVARELGLPVYAYPGLEQVKRPTEYRPPAEESVLEEAQRIVAGDRGDQYGHPGDDFARTAGAWHALFGWEVTPAQVALAMVVVKLSRLQETPLKRDSVVDIAGYAQTYEMVQARDEGGLR